MHGFYRWSAKWWPGLVPLAVLWAVAAWFSTPVLEANLTSRSTEALKSTVLDKTQISVAGRDVNFAAEAFSEEGRRSAVGSVEAVPGVRLVNDGTRLVAEAKPFVWVAERDNVRVTLWGTAPLPASKARIAEAAKTALAGTEVSDRMGLKRGAPPRFDGAAVLLLEQVAKLKQQRVDIDATIHELEEFIAMVTRQIDAGDRPAKRASGA